MITQGLRLHPPAALRRLFALLLAAMLGLLPYRADGVQLSMETPVTTETAVLAVTVQNNSRRALICGVEPFTLEQKTADGWAQLREREHAVIEIAVVLSPLQSAKLSVDLMQQYGRLLAVGTYRLTFRYIAEDGHEGPRNQAQLTFDVTEL